MAATDSSTTKLDSLDTEIAKLTREIATAGADVHAALDERLIALRTTRDGIRREVVDTTSRALSELNGKRTQAEKDLAAATGAARTRAENKLGQVKSALTETHQRLQTQVGAVIKDTDDEIATLTAQATAASGPATQRLESAVAQLRAQRDTLQAKVATLEHVAAGQWRTAKTDFDVSMQELTSLRERGATGVN